MGDYGDLDVLSGTNKACFVLRRCQVGHFHFQMFHIIILSRQTLRYKANRVLLPSPKYCSRVTLDVHKSDFIAKSRNTPKRSKIFFKENNAFIRPGQK